MDACRIPTLTRNPSSVDQFDQTAGNHCAMVHPWPHHDAQDPQGFAKGDCWLRLFGETRPRRGWSKSAGGTPWKSLSSIVGTKRVVSCKLSSKTFAVGKHLTELMCHLSNLSSTSGLHRFSQHAWANPPCHFVHDSTSRCSGAWLPDEDVPVLGVSLKPTKKHGM